MTSWVDELTPEERNRWDAFGEHFRRDALEKISGSAAFVSILSSTDNVDVQFCCELGAAIMLDKPIVAVTLPGVRLPAKLREIADHVVEADIDTGAGRDELASALTTIVKAER